jgi:hypothetical protein
MDDAALPADSLIDLLRGLQAGESIAERRLLADYLSRLTHLAARQIGDRYQSKVCPDAVAVAALNSFISRFPKSDWQVPDREALWLLLAKITRRKCDHERRRFRGIKRDALREVPHGDATGDTTELMLPTTEPGPDEVAVFRDLLSWLLESGDERDREIIRMRLNGETVAAISAEVNYSERGVMRKLEKLRNRLQAQLDE